MIAIYREKIRNYLVLPFLAALRYCAVAQAKYCNKFQLTHMPRGNHAQSIASNGGQKEGKTLLQHSQLSQHGEFGMQASLNDSDHGRVVRIFVCLS